MKLQRDLEIVCDQHWRSDKQMLDSILALGLEDDLETLLSIDVVSLACECVKVQFKH